ncbi:MAG: FAD-binding oxidoreductase [Deltaproteobacteria bacterium]|nr:FAD-binding oxidoreductase [Deltaproteobacteria bacterium]
MHPDVLIVGAGVAGLATADALARRGARVLLLEAGTQIGAEASSQNAGMVRRLGDDPIERALARRTHEALLDLDADPDFADAPVSRRSGALLLLGHEPMRLHDAAAHLHALGVAIKRLDGPAAIAAAVQSPLLQGCPAKLGWYDAEARVADAHALCRGLLARARRHGATLRTEAPVAALRRDGERIVGVQLADGTALDAGAVVLAAGAWTAGLCASVGLWRPLLPLRRTLLQTERHPGSHPDAPWIWLDDAGLYARPEAGGFLVSACDEALDPPRPGAASRLAPDPRAIALFHAKAQRLFPTLAGVRLRGGWSGLRTFAPDRAPMLGPDAEAPGLHLCAGLGGYGISCGLAAGEVVAASVLDAAPAWLDAPAVAPHRHTLRRFPLLPDGDTSRARLLDVATARARMSKTCTQ